MVYLGAGANHDVARVAALRPWHPAAPSLRLRRPPHGWESLTPKELEVVQLVVDGRSNPEIGARLYISSHGRDPPRTSSASSASRTAPTWPPRPTAASSHCDRTPSVGSDVAGLPARPMRRNLATRCGESGGRSSSVREKGFEVDGEQVGVNRRRRHRPGSDLADLAPRAPGGRRDWPSERTRRSGREDRACAFEAASSPQRALTGCGSPTSPSTPPTKDASTAQWCSTPGTVR